MQIKGTLEVDENRGVIWFHSEDGITALRICGLPVNLHEDVKKGIGDVTVLEYFFRDGNARTHVAEQLARVIQEAENDFMRTHERVERSIGEES